MRDKIGMLKESMETMDLGHFEVVAALERLDEEMVGNLIYPGQTKLENVVNETIAEIKNQNDSAHLSNSKLSNRWAKLRCELEIWEQDHPRITMIVGDVARALAAAGL